MFARWLTASLVAIGLGLAALQLSTCLAVEPRAPVGAGIHGPAADAPEAGAPIGAGEDASEPSALPHFTP